MRPGADGRRTLPLLLAAAAVGLAAGYALKSPCAPGDWRDGRQYRRLCYSDIVPLYGARGLDRDRFPYLGSTPETRAARADVEYPAGTGLYLGLVARTVDSLVAFFNANAAGLALMGLVAAGALAAMARDPRRVLLFALGPALVLYAFHNWDLLAVGLATLAMYALHRRADGSAGFLLGLGAATKLYPALLLPAFGLAAWRRRRAVPWRMAGAFALAVALINVPLAIANFEGWKYPWDFQSARAANFETSWFMIYRHTGGGWFFDSSLVNAISGVAFAAAAGLLLALEARRERVRPYALGFGILVAFLLTAKVFSPQYALWLLPFFAVLSLPLWSYAAFAVADAAVWIGISSYFLAAAGGGGDPEFRLALTEVAVWARYGVLIALLALSRRAEELVAEPGVSPARRAPVALSA